MGEEEWFYTVSLEAAGPIGGRGLRFEGVESLPPRHTLLPLLPLFISTSRGHLLSLTLSSRSHDAPPIHFHTHSRSYPPHALVHSFMLKSLAKLGGDQAGASYPGLFQNAWNFMGDG